MEPKETMRMVFWILVFFLVAFTFYTIASYFLPRLIRFQHLPTTGERIVDSADFVEERLAYYACGIWENRKQLGASYSESLHAKPIGADVTEAGIRAHFTGDCADIKISIIGGLGKDDERKVKFNGGLSAISMEFCNRIGIGAKAVDVCLT